MAALHVSKFEVGAGINLDRALTYFRFAEVYFRVEWETSLPRHGFKAVQSYLKMLENPWSIKPSPWQSKCRAQRIQPVITKTEYGDGYKQQNVEV